MGRGCRIFELFPSRLFHVENEKRDIPKKELVLLAECFHVSADYILGLTDEKKPYPRGG